METKILSKEELSGYKHFSNSQKAFDHARLSHYVTGDYFHIMYDKYQGSWVVLPYNENVSDPLESIMEAI